jgi:anti-anti-sigma factor
MRKSTGARHPLARLPRPMVVRDESVTVSFSGDLTAHSAPMMRLHLLSLACDDGPGEIIVDLSNVTWIDRAGVEPLVEAHRLQLRRGSILRLTGLSAPVIIS